MRYRWRVVSFFLIVAVALMGFLPQNTAVAKGGKKSCKSLCSAVVKKTGGAGKLKYTSRKASDFGALSFREKSKVKKMQYSHDKKEVYGVCIIEAKKAAGAKSLYTAVKKYVEKNCDSNNLKNFTLEEQSVLTNAIYGRKGKYVWYIAMSDQKEKNGKGEKALKKKL